MQLVESKPCIWDKTYENGTRQNYKCRACRIVACSNPSTGSCRYRCYADVMPASVSFNVKIPTCT